MKGKRKHDILNIFTMIIYCIPKAPISTLIKIIYLKGKYFFIHSIYVPESALLSQKKFHISLFKTNTYLHRSFTMKQIYENEIFCNK